MINIYIYDKIFLLISNFIYLRFTFISLEGQVIPKNKKYMKLILLFFILYSTQKMKIFYKLRKIIFQIKYTNIYFVLARFKND